MPPGPAAPARPALRVIEGGRAPATLARRATYLRRRLLALALLVVVACAAAVLLVGAISTGLAGGGHPSSAAGASSPTSADAASAAGVARDRLHAVPGRPARRHALVDRRVDRARTPTSAQTVDRLVAANGDAPLTVGEHLRLP